MWHFTLAYNFPCQLMYEISHLICDPRNIIIDSSFELSLYLAKCCWLYIMCTEAVFCHQFASRNLWFSLVVVFSFCLLHFIVYWKTRERFWTTWYRERLNKRQGCRKPEHHVVRADKFRIIPPDISKRDYRCSLLFTYKNVYEFTFTEVRALGNGEVHR